MSEVLLTQEVGSLAKPNWRVEAVRDHRFTTDHAMQAQAWSDRLGLDRDQTEWEIQQIQETFGCELADQECVAYGDELVRDLAARLAIGLQTKAGLDIIYDGEQDRTEMYEFAIDKISGFDWRGRISAFDNKSYRVAAAIGDPRSGNDWHSSELARLQNLTTKPVKVPITGAYTLAAWSYNETDKSRAELVEQIAHEVIRPNISDLLKEGADWIQIDEPAATTVPSEVPLFVESVRRSVEGLVGKFSVHMCFPTEYQALFPHIAELPVDQLSLELANHDGATGGCSANSRPAYEVLTDFAQHCPEVAFGLGVVSVHEVGVESPQLVRDRILRAVDIVGDPAKIYPQPDCGLRTRSWAVAYDKLRTVVEGTQLAKDELGVA